MKYWAKFYVSVIIFKVSNIPGAEYLKDQLRTCSSIKDKTYFVLWRFERE